MTTIQVAGLIVSLTTAFAYINARFIKLPSQIGLLAISLVASLVVVGLDAVGAIEASGIQHVVARVDLGPTLLHGMLGLLLFAGSLHIRLGDLQAQRWPILFLSVGGTVLSTVIVGALVYAVLGGSISLLDAMLFGALISPTDPIAVLGALKSSKVPRPIAVQISGESLFNDGVGVTLFVVILALRDGADLSAGEVIGLFARLALGGAAFGLVLGYATNRLLCAVDDFAVEILLTLALVLGGYALAEAIGVSAPIAAVVAGIAVGNRPAGATNERLDIFWEVIDEILNAVLFLMLGLEATRLHVSSGLAIAAAVSIAIVLLARFASVALTNATLRPFTGKAAPHAVKLLTWGGLRGGLSVALALSLPAAAPRDSFLVMTYAVVAFAILVQGLTLPRLLRRLGLGS